MFGVRPMFDPGPQVHRVLEEIRDSLLNWVVSGKPLVTYLEESDPARSHRETPNHALLLVAEHWQGGALRLRDFIPNSCVHGIETRYLRVLEASNCVGAALRVAFRMPWSRIKTPEEDPTASILGFLPYRKETKEEVAALKEILRVASYGVVRAEYEKLREDLHGAVKKGGPRKALLAHTRLSEAEILIRLDHFLGANRREVEIPEAAAGRVERFLRALYENVVAEIARLEKVKKEKAA